MPLWPGEVPELNPGWKKKGWVPTITPYLLGKAKDRGIVIVFPGGGYNGRAEHEGVPVARFFNGAGFSAAVVNYRVQCHDSPAPLGTGPLLDAQRAIRLVRSHAAEWGVRPDRVAVLGFSAGAHLAAMAGTHFDNGAAGDPDPVERVSSRPDAMVLCYGALLYHRVTAGNLMGPDSTEKDFAFYSCERNVCPDSPPAFFWHTATDQGVPIRNSLAMAEALHTAGVSVELHIFPTGQHGLGLAEGEPHVNQWTGLCVKWLAMQGV
jgi:acetyl esterase/lipase